MRFHLGVLGIELMLLIAPEVSNGEMALKRVNQRFAD